MAAPVRRLTILATGVGLTGRDHSPMAGDDIAAIDPTALLWNGSRLSVSRSYRLLRALMP